MRFGGKQNGLRKTVQMMIILTILAWATQTLLTQWGLGATPAPDQPAPTEKFVPAADSVGVTLELRDEVTVLGGDVRLKQVARWSDADRAAFEPIADLIVMRLPPKTPFQSLRVDDLKSLLHDAGVNMARIQVVGAMTCTVTRQDIPFDENKAMRQWVNARHGNTEDVDDVPTTRPVASTDAPATAPATTSAAGRSLRDALTADLAERLTLPADSLQVDFSPKDEALLRLVEPHFQFAVDGRNIHNLGDVRWDVTVTSEGGSRKASVSGNARAWQQQVVVGKPMAYGQVIGKDDVTTRRVLADRLSDDPLLSMQQVVGQQAARDLSPGALLTGRTVAAVTLAHPGQLITVIAETAGVQIKTVAEARESGCSGQTIRVRKPGTREEYNVVLTGPQEAKVVAGAQADAKSDVASGRD